jgi:hypothetical protein
VDAAKRTIGLALVLASSASCKFDELPRLEDPDAVKPCEMAVTDLAPAVLYEGTGVGGSRRVVLVVSGQNFVNANTHVSMTPAAGSSVAPMIEIDNANLAVGDKGTHLAVPISLPVDPVLGASAMGLLDVMITQDCATGPVSAALPGRLAFKGLDELTDANSSVTLTGGVHEYSQIDVPTKTLASAAAQTSPLVLRSMSSVKIVKNISIDAVGRTGGPAGGTGGMGGPILGAGTPGTGPSPGLPSGGPGGFDATDPELNTLKPPNRSSGGAGGNGASLGSGGNGGGGGGSIEISAGGDLQVGAISARGAAGAAGSGGGGAGGGAGGGGSGGVILLRAGGALTAGDIDVSGGGAGARGRARYDAGGTATVSAGSLGTDHLRGPMFKDLPLAVHTSKPQFTVVGKPLSRLQHFVITRNGPVSSLSHVSLDSNGTVRITLEVDLVPGVNQLCLVTESGTETSETANCANIAYLP